MSEALITRLKRLMQAGEKAEVTLQLQIDNALKNEKGQPNFFKVINDAGLSEKRLCTASFEELERAFAVFDGNVFSGDLEAVIQGRFPDRSGWRDQLLEMCTPGTNLEDYVTAARREFQSEQAATKRLAEKAVVEATASAARDVTPIKDARSVVKQVASKVEAIAAAEKEIAGEVAEVTKATTGRKAIPNGGKIAIIGGSVALLGTLGYWAFRVKHCKAQDNQSQLASGDQAVPSTAQR